VLDALEHCRERGWLRVAAYSGENEALEFAIASGRVEVVQLSVNVCDQLSLTWLAKRRAEGLGAIAKRPLAERPWTRAAAPEDPPAREYWQRFRTMFGDESDPAWQARALRFAAFAPGVDCCIVGSTQAANIDRNLRELEAGPLPEEERAAITAAFAANSHGWRGVV
jgi:aryl-alcohol dehydrogenase-like predicted oxidoreductase